MSTIKESAKKIIDNLSEEATWDDLMYEIYVVQKVERGLKAIDEGKTIPIEEVKKRFLNK